jgi:parvulin-like peptidyl-prolyl isomerase
MGLITKMRSQMQVVMWTILVLFVTSMAIGGLVGGASITDIFGQRQINEIGSVNSNPILFEDFNSFVSSEISRSDGRNGETLTDDQKEFIRAIVWERIISDLIIQEQIEKNKIVVSDSEVVFHLQNNPPSFLKSNAMFQTDGKFDFEKYLGAVLAPTSIDWRPIENFMKEVYLPNYKLQQYIINSASINPEIVKNDFRKRFVDYELEILHLTDKVIDNSKFDEKISNNINESVVQKFYSDNLENYKQQEKRFLKFVKWPILSTQNDSLRTKLEAEDIVFRLKNGADFASLANSFSEDPGNFIDPSNPSGGRLGWFSDEQMNPEFSRAAFSAEVGDIVGPVLTEFGYHIIKINDKNKKDKKNQVNASHILLTIKPGDTTKELIYNDARLFSLDATESGFENQANIENLQIFSSNEIVKESVFINENDGPVRSAVNFAFKNEVGAISDAFDNDDFIFVFYLDSILNESYVQFDDVKLEIENNLKSEFKREEIKSIAKSLEINSESNLADIAKENQSFEYIKSTKSKLNGSFLSIGKSNFVVGALLESSIGQLVGPIPTLRGQAFIKIVNIDEINQKDFDEMKDSIKFSLLINRQNLIWDNWLQALRDNSDIKDYRYDFY